MFVVKLTDPEIENICVYEKDIAICKEPSCKAEIFWVTNPIIETDGDNN